MRTEKKAHAAGIVTVCHALRPLSIAFLKQHSNAFSMFSKLPRFTMRNHTRPKTVSEGFLLFYKIFNRLILGMLLTFPSIASAQFLDAKWMVTEYFGELWFAEEEDILGKHQEFYKGWADGVFYSCDYAGQSATYNTHTIREFLVNKEFELVNQEKAFSKVFEENGLMNENTEVFVHRITCNGSKVADRKVLYPFITIDGSNKAFYVYEGAIITFTFEK